MVLRQRESRSPPFFSWSPPRNAAGDFFCGLPQGRASSRGRLRVALFPAGAEGGNRDEEIRINGGYMLFI